MSWFRRCTQFPSKPSALKAFSTSALTSKSQPNSVLVRDFIHDRLYDETEGFFSKGESPGRLKEPLRFSEYKNAADYVKGVRENYPSNCWLTPVELFQPHYGRALADYIYSESKDISGPIKIVEIGGGTGICAATILDRFMRRDPRTYSRIEYTMVEISPELSKVQLDLLSSRHPDLFGPSSLSDAKTSKSNPSGLPRGRVVNSSILDWDHRTEEKTFIVAMEVLDNLPHDKLVRSTAEDPWQQVRVVRSGNPKKPFDEVLEPLSDPLIVDALKMWETAQEHQRLNQPNLFLSAIRGIAKKLAGIPAVDANTLFLPTCCLSLFRRLHEQIPRHRLVFADFDMLPPSLVSGMNAPIVSQKGDAPEAHTDFDTYLVSRGQADIFFPTDFAALNFMYHSVTRRQGHVLKTKDFMLKYADYKRTYCQNGYNPLLEDFKNTSFFLS